MKPASLSTIGDILDQDFQKTPDPVSIKGGRTKGRRSKLSVMEFWYVLFEQNELRPRDKKMTNAEIARQMVAEFPDRETVQKLIDKPCEVNTFRYLYNTRALLSYRKDRPKAISFRYNEAGDKVDSKTGRILTAIEIKKIIDKYTNWEPKERTRPYAPRKSKRKKTKRVRLPATHEQSAQSD